MEPLIYIVEDDEGICEVYEGAFEGEYQTKLFENGASFLKEFDAKRPDIIILDIMLPDMDGYTILYKIRELDERVPVIIVSAKSDEISLTREQPSQLNLKHKRLRWELFYIAFTKDLR